MHALIRKRPSDIWGFMQLSTSTSKHIITSTWKKKLKSVCLFLRIPAVDNLSEHPVSLQQWIKCMGKGWPPRVLHMIGLSNCRGEMQIFKHSTSEGSWPDSVSSFHLLENVASAFHSWGADVNILVQCSCSLPESCLSASLFCEACQLLSQVFLARNFHAPLQT